MMRLLHFIGFGCFTTAASCIAQPAFPPNKLPIYGDIENTPEMKAADEALVAGVAKTRQQAAIELVNREMKTLGDGDAAPAIQRFKRARPLDPDCSGVSVGFGGVLSDRKHNAEAETMFKRAIELPSAAADAYASYAMFLNKEKCSTEAITAEPPCLSMRFDVEPAN